MKLPRFQLTARSAAWLHAAALAGGLGIGAAIAAPADPAADLTRAIRLVERHYVTPMTDEELYEKAMAGMLQKLDSRSRYLPPAEYAELVSDKRGNYAGIGIVTEIHEGRPRLTEVGADGPAARAGLRRHDVLLSVDGKSTEGMSNDELVQHVRGPQGSTVRLTWRQADGQTGEAAVRRATINVPSVRSARLTAADGAPLLVLRISEFTESTAREIVEQLRRHRDSRPAGLILDLRHNPGGLLAAAVDAASLFLPPGKVVLQTRRRDQKDVEKTHATPAENLPFDPRRLPMAVLIDGQSASAAEILAASLDDHARATLVGSRSYGKGSIQSILPFGSDRGLLVTSALYLTPAGKAVDKVGITPRIPVAPPEGKAETPSPARQDASFSNDAKLLPDDAALEAAARHLRAPAAHTPG